jgi:hypothetical protein
VVVSDNNLESHFIFYKEESASYYRYVLCQGWKIVGIDTILSTILLVPVIADTVHIYRLQALNNTILNYCQKPQQ